jgi:hypothetical protein
MKIVISEQQLQRIIREFYEKGYNLGDYDVIQKIKDEVRSYNNNFRELSVDERADKIQEFTDFINNTIYNNFKDYYKDFFDEEMNKIVRNNLLEQRTLDIYFFGDDGAKGVYFWTLGGLSTDGLNYVINFIKNKLDVYIQPKVEKSIERNPYKLAPKYSGNWISDDLQKRIYDWEHSKVIIEKLYHNYMISNLVDDYIFDKLKSKNYIDAIFVAMDKEMEKNDFKLFPLIREKSVKKDFNNFVNVYIDYYSNKFPHPEQFSIEINPKKNLPIEIFMGRVFRDMNKSI